jgi:hypothetical protein
MEKANRFRFCRNNGVTAQESVRTEKGLVRFCFCIFSLCFVFNVFAHAATRLAAVLTEAAILTGVLLKEDNFSHFLY